MKVTLARQYRIWMLVLLPTTLGLGTVALWWRSRDWPLTIDESGLILRRRTRVDWRFVSNVGVSRS
jgi:hypothetical protein